MTAPDLDAVLDDEDGKRAARDPKLRRAELGKLADLLGRSGISVEDVHRVNRVNAWQGMIKKPIPCERCHSTGKVPDGLDDSGQEVTCPACAGAKRTFEPETVDMVGIQLVPEWAQGPAWPVVAPAKPKVVRYSRKAIRPKTSYKTTVLLPDTQTGFRRLDTGEMVPMHDEQAMACSLELLSVIRPARIIWLGDGMDFAEWSNRWLILPEFVLTTQQTVDRQHTYLADCLAAAGPQVLDADSEDDKNAYLEGNHDDRLPKAIARNAMAAMRLRRANAPQEWPVLSVPNLLHLDELGIRYADGYPAGRVPVAKAHGSQASLWALHGERLSMEKQARASHISTVQGHAHHFSYHTETYFDDDGSPHEVVACSLGCLCRTDGVVPSTHSGTGVRGRHVESVESWQHGIGVVVEDEESWDLMPVRIHDGRARWGDVVVSAPKKEVV